MAFLPDYWWPTDANTVITQETSPLFRRKGTAAARVFAPTAALQGDLAAETPILPVLGSGIVSSPIPVRPTEFKPFYTVQVSMWVIGGAVRLELWDVTDCSDIIIWPPRESDKRAVTTVLGNWVDNLAVAPGEDFFAGATTGRITTQFQIALIADVLDTEFVLDAAMLTNEAAGMPTFVEGKGANLLVIAGNDDLLLRKDPLSTYALRALEFTRKDAVTWPGEAFDIGVTSRLKVDNFILDIEPRITSFDRDLNQELNTKVKVESEEETLSRQLAQTQRQRRNIQRETEELTNRPASVAGLSGAITN